MFKSQEISIEKDKTLFTREELDDVIAKCDMSMRKFSYYAVKAVEDDCEKHACLAESGKIEKLKDASNEYRQAFADGCRFMGRYFESQWKEFKEKNSQ